MFYCILIAPLCNNDLIFIDWTICTDAHLCPFSQTGHLDFLCSSHFLSLYFVAYNKILTWENDAIGIILASLRSHSVSSILNGTTWDAIRSMTHRLINKCISTSCSTLQNIEAMSISPPWQNGRHFLSTKLLKDFEWLLCKNVKQNKDILGLVSKTGESILIKIKCDLCFGEAFSIKYQTPFCIHHTIKIPSRTLAAGVKRVLCVKQIGLLMELLVDINDIHLVLVENLHSRYCPYFCRNVPDKGFHPPQF